MTSKYKRVPAPFPYAGSKGNLIARCLDLIPNHETFVSVFGGSAGEIRWKQQSRNEVFNEIDRHIVNVFRVIQSPFDLARLHHMVATTYPSERLYEDCLQIVKEPTNDAALNAWAYIAVSNSSFLGNRPIPWFRGSFRPYDRWPRLAEQLLALAARFQDVTIEDSSWNDVIDKYDSPETLLFLDPPYLPGTREDALYFHEMTTEEHVELLERIQHVESMVWLCGYASDLYDEMLANWRRIEVSARCAMSGESTKPERTEVIRMNFDEQGNRLVSAKKEVCVEF